MSLTRDEPEGARAEPASATRCGDVIFVDGGDAGGGGGHAGQLGASLDGIGARLAEVAADPGDLVFLRLFYVDDGLVEEAGLLGALAGRRPPGGSGSRVAVTLVPVRHLGGTGGLVRLEGVAMRGADGGRLARAYAAGERGALPGRLAGGVRCEGFVFLSARSAPDARSLPEQSVSVMGRLAGMLAELGAGFGDVVKMNRWYAAAGTTDAWEPSARAVAASFAEPGPVATAISLPGGFRDGGLIRVDLLAMRSRTGAALAKRHAWPAGHWDWPIHLPYKHGLRCGAFTFVGGQVSIDERARVVDPGDLPAQTEQSLRNVERVLGEFGSGPADVVRLWAYHAGPVDPPGAAGAALAARLGRFAGPTVARTCIPFPYLSYPGMRVEIEAIAWRDPALTADGS